jgi:hypothetical protein
MQKHVVNTILPKMGINQKAAQAVVFGTAHYGGGGIDHLTTVQSHGHLQYRIGSLRCNDTINHLIRMMLEYTKLEYRCRKYVLEE